MDCGGSAPLWIESGEAQDKVLSLGHFRRAVKAPEDWAQSKTWRIFVGHPVRFARMSGSGNLPVARFE